MQLINHYIIYIYIVYKYSGLKWHLHLPAFKYHNENNLSVEFHYSLTLSAMSRIFCITIQRNDSFCSHRIFESSYIKFIYVHLQNTINYNIGNQKINNYSYN